MDYKKLYEEQLKETEFAKTKVISLTKKCVKLQERNKHLIKCRKSLEGDIVKLNGIWI